MAQAAAVRLSSGALCSAHPSGPIWAACPAGHGIAVILGFPSTFLLCWVPCALDPMPAYSSLYSFILSEVTATSEVRPGWENLKFILYSSSPSTTLIKPCRGPVPGKGGSIVFPALHFESAVRPCRPGCGDQEGAAFAPVLLLGNPEVASKVLGMCW